MGYVSRLAGAMLVSTEGEYFLVGNPKEPFDFVAAGWQDPGVVDALTTPYVRLQRAQAGKPQPPEEVGPRLLVAVEGEDLARWADQRFVIRRNASVSERLWRLVWGEMIEQASGEPPASPVLLDGAWLADMPDRVWAAVRDSVLRCS